MISNDCRSSFKHFDYLMGIALDHKDHCEVIADCHIIGRNLIHHRILKTDNILNRPVEVQPLNAGVPVGNFPNQSGPLDSLLNFGRSKNPSNLLKKFSILGTTGKLFETLRLLTFHSIHNFFLGKITILLICIIVLATIGTIIGFKISKDDNPSTTTTLATSTTIQPTTSTTIQSTTPTGLFEM